MRTESKQGVFRRISVMILFGMVTFTLGILPLMAANKPYRLELGTELNIGELHIPAGKSQILLSPQPLQQLIIGNPGIADVKLLGDREVLILGKSPGTTNLAFRDKQKKVIALMDVVVGYDLEAIKRKLYEVLPEEEGINVRSANDTVILSGNVSSLAAMDMALSIAQSYVTSGRRGESGKLINQLQVGGGQQVMLEVTISEISRTAEQSMGFRTEFTDGEFSVLMGGVPASSFGTATSTGRLFMDSLNLTIGALEEQGLAKILAEPKLVALSGAEASFLAGGEFAIPTAAGDSGGTTVEFKEFGVGLKFRPTVLSNKRISLKLNTEVSDISQTLGTSVFIVGAGAVATTPGVTTRRAATTIELGDGESFMIAGLLQNDIDNLIDKFPGLGDIPVLGPLFRSPDFKRDETELVIAVTPHLVKPAAADALAFPSDNFIPPNDVDTYYYGRLEGTEAEPKVMESAPSGIEGSYGHQL